MPRHTNKTNAQRYENSDTAVLTAVARATVYAQRVAAAAVISARSAHVTSGRALVVARSAQVVAKKAETSAERAVREARARQKHRDMMARNRMNAANAKQSKALANALKPTREELLKKARAQGRRNAYAMFSRVRRASR